MRLAFQLNVFAVTIPLGGRKPLTLVPLPEPDVYEMKRVDNKLVQFDKQDFFTKLKLGVSKNIEQMSVIEGGRCFNISVVGGLSESKLAFLSSGITIDRVAYVLIPEPKELTATTNAP